MADSTRLIELVECWTSHARWQSLHSHFASYQKHSEEQRSNAVLRAKYRRELSHDPESREHYEYLISICSAIVDDEKQAADVYDKLHGNLASELNELRQLVRERSPDCLGFIPIQNYENPPDSAGEIVLAREMTRLLGDLLERGRDGGIQSADAGRSEPAAKRKGDKIAHAIAVLSLHPDWNNKQIAEAAEAHEKTLSNSKRFKAVRGAVKASGQASLRRSSHRDDGDDGDD